MQSKGATNLAHEVYGPNVRALTDVREYLLVEGLDIDAAGDVVVGYHPHGDEQRMVHKLPAVENTLSEVTVRATKDAPERIVHKFNPYNDDFDLREQFMNDMGRSGGFMALPFPLDFNSGQPTQKSEDGYLLPLMGADLRSGQDFSEDTSGSVHAYTRNYMYIYENACKYQYLDYLKKNKEYYNFYSDDKEYLKSEIVSSGDVILLANGGHGFECMEETEMFEIKQGPYAGENDKTRFEPHKFV